MEQDCGSAPLTLLAYNELYSGRWDGTLKANDASSDVHQSHFAPLP